MSIMESTWWHSFFRNESRRISASLYIYVESRLPPPPSLMAKLIISLFTYSMISLCLLILSLLRLYTNDDHKIQLRWTETKTIWGKIHTEKAKFNLTEFADFVFCWSNMYNSNVDSIHSFSQMSNFGKFKHYTNGIQWTLWSSYIYILCHIRSIIQFWYVGAIIAIVIIIQLSH